MTPYQILYQFDRQHGDAWQWVQLAKLGRGTVFESWSDTVHLPLSMAAEIMSSLHESRRKKINQDDLAQQSVMLHVLSAWRTKQTYYQFSPDLYRSTLAGKNASLNAMIPSGRLPNDCIYIETPGLVTPLLDDTPCPVHGVWVIRDYSMEDGKNHLGFLMNLENTDPAASFLESGKRLGEAISELEHYDPEKPNQEWHDGYGDAAREMLPKLLALTLFILDNPDHPGLHHDTNQGLQPGFTQRLQ